MQIHTTSTETCDQYTVSVDKAVDQVFQKQTEWKLLDPKIKLELLDLSLKELYATRELYHQIALQRRNYTLEKNPTKPNAIKTEEVLVSLTCDIQAGCWMKSIRYAYEAIATKGKFPQPLRVNKVTDKKTIVVTLPFAAPVQQFISGVELELYVESEAITDTVSFDASLLQYEPEDYFKNNEGVSVVLGAGNYDAPLDILTALFLKNTVVIYKLYPFALDLVKVFYKVFKPFVDKHYLVFCSGDLNAAKQLLYDSKVTHWLMTGGSATANKILYGENKSPFQDRILDSISEEEIKSKLATKDFKKYTFELGNVAPYIICPGKWTQAELLFHAKHLAFALLFNGGHICVHPQIIITCKHWKHRETFFDLLQQEIEKAELLHEFYPRASERFEALCNKYNDEKILVETSKWKHGDVVMIRDCPTTSQMLKEETFCRISAEVCLDTDPTIEAFLPSAVQFCNQHVSGSLGATIILNESPTHPVLCQCIEDLEYGAIAINIWVISIALFPQLRWGAHPKHSNIAHLRSGVGFLGNCFGFKNPIKSVLISPFQGYAHRFQMIPKLTELHRMDKMLQRITSSTCRTSENAITTAIDVIKIAFAHTFGL